MTTSETPVKKIRVILDTQDQYIAAQWATWQVSNYMENLQDDQSMCLDCAAPDYAHVKGGYFDPIGCSRNHEPIVTDHMYLGLNDYKDFESETGQLPNGKWYLDIALEPGMVMSFFVNNVFYPNGDFDQSEDGDFYSFDCKPKEDGLASTIWLKIHDALERC
jgi:hypothetical protein